MEATVPPSEVELHRDDAAGGPHPAAECIRRLEEDSDADSDEEAAEGLKAAQPQHIPWEPSQT